MGIKRIVHLTERPSRCTTCGASRVVAHDNIVTKCYGAVKTFRCTECGEHFYVYASKVLMLVAAVGIREHWDDLVQMVGLIALGMPLIQIENLMGGKQETFWARFQKCRASIPLWHEITSALKTRWKFRARDIARLHSFSPRAKDHGSPFHIAFVLTPKPNLLCDVTLRKKREFVRRKVQQILQREVAYTGAGEFVFADMDAGQIAWVRTIRKAPPDQLNLLEEPFYQIASHVRYPNEETHEIARALAYQTAPVQSLTALCEGFYLKVPLPVFLEDIKDIAKALRFG